MVRHAAHGILAKFRNYVMSDSQGEPPTFLALAMAFSLFIVVIALFVG